MSAGDLPLYPRLLGDAAERLPPVIRRMHAAAPRVVASGRSTVTHGDNPVARFLARRLGLPQAGRDRALRVSFEAEGEAERLSRHYPDTVLATLQSPAGPPGSGRLVEQFGPFRLLLKLSASERGIDFALIGVRWHGLPLPRPAWPRLQASERAEGDNYRFHVRIGLPVLGRLIEYEGVLTIVAPAEVEAAAARERQQVLTSGPLVLFDGVCNLCNGSVRFLAPRDRTGRLRFAAIQSPAGQAVLRRYALPLEDWDSFILLEDGRVHRKSAAFFRVARFMTWPWKPLRLGRLLPARVADFFYDRIARNRYALFGRKQECLVPDANLRAKFVS